MAYVERARLLKRLGRLLDAEVDIAHALSLNRAGISAQYEVGATSHDTEAADRAFRLACAHSLPRYPCLLEWSDALRRSGSATRADAVQDEALEELDRLTRTFWRPEHWQLDQEKARKRYRGSQPHLGDPPPLPEHQATRCETLMQSDRAAAREHCERAVRLAPKETAYREKLAQFHASDEDGSAHDRAIGILGEALAADPNSPSTLIALAKQFEAVRDFEAARMTWAEAVMHDEDNGWLQNQLAVVLEEAGLLDQALPHYRTAWALLPEDVIIANNLASALSRTGAHEEALAPARYAYEHRSNDQAAAFRFVECLRAIHRWEEASAALDNWITVHPRDWQAINMRAGFGGRDLENSRIPAR